MDIVSDIDRANKKEKTKLLDHVFIDFKLGLWLAIFFVIAVAICLGRLAYPDKTLETAVAGVSVFGLFIIIISPTLTDRLGKSIKEGIKEGFSEIKISENVQELKESFKLSVGTLFSGNSISEDDLNKLKECFRQKHFEEARKIINELISKYHGNLYPYLYYAVSFLEDKNFSKEEAVEKASKYINEAAKIDANNIDLFYYQAMLEEKKGDIPKALQVARRAKKKAESLIEKSKILNLEAVLLWQDNKIDEGIKILNEAHTLLGKYKVDFNKKYFSQKDTVYLKVHNTLGYLLAERHKGGDLKRALEIADFLKSLKEESEFDKEISSDIFYARIQDTIGFIYFNLYQYKEDDGTKERLSAAVKHLNEAYTLFPCPLYEKQLNEATQKLEGI